MVVLVQQARRVDEGHVAAVLGLVLQDDGLVRSDAVPLLDLFGEVGQLDLAVVAKLLQDGIAFEGQFGDVAGEVVDHVDVDGAFGYSAANGIHLLSKEGFHEGGFAVALSSDDYDFRDGYLGVEAAWIDDRRMIDV